MSSPSGTPSRGGPVARALVVGVIILVAPWTLIILAVATFDLDYIIQTARTLQDLLVTVLTGAALIAALAGGLALAAGAMGVRFLWHRTTGDVLRAELQRRGDVAMEQARQSQYPSLTSYTYSPRYEYEVTAAPPAPALAAPGAQPPALPAPPPGQLLQELRARGVIGVGNRLVLGLQGTEVVPVEVGVASMIAIGGGPRMGKSTCAAWIISQAAMSGWPVYLCDPHGRDAQSILARVEPIAHLLARAATTPEEMAEAIAAFNALGQGRVHGGDADRTPALLVIDELPELAMSGQLPRAVMETLIRIGSAYPKAGLLMVGIGYDWSATVMNSPYAAPLRRLALPRVTVNADPAGAEHLVGKRLASQARDLKRGQALFVGYGDYGLIEIPQVSRDDLVSIASLCPTPPPAPALMVLEHAVHAPAAASVAEPPLDERIVGYLRSVSAPQGSKAISDALKADNDQVCARLVELVAAGRLTRSGAKRNYVYALPDSLPHPRTG